MRVRRLEKQEMVELFAGTPERRAALERDWNDVVAMVAEIDRSAFAAFFRQTYLD